MSEVKEIDWGSQPLGKITDAALAAQLGVTISRVTHARRRYGIPGLRVVKDAERLAGPGRGEINWDLQPLGQVSDLELAKALGTHRARVRLARVYRGIPLFVEREDPGTRGVDRELERYRDSRWYRHPVTAEPCRYCTEARNKRALRGRRDQMVRWTDQGPSCSAHYAALPSCQKCDSPVTNDGDLCEECLTIVIRAERERGGWRKAIPTMPPAMKHGDVDAVRRGLRAFERKHGIQSMGPE